MLRLHGAEIVRGVPDIFGESAAKIVNANFGANSGALLECLPLLGETRRGTGLLTGARLAEQVHDRRLTVDIWRKSLDGFGDGGADRERLMHVALGVEGQRAKARVVVCGADFGGRAVTESEIGAEQQEETERGRGGVDGLQPAEKTAETLRVGRARVLREAGRFPCGGGALNVIGGELSWTQLAEIG